MLTLFGVVTVIFFLFNVLPGDPAQMMLGQNEDSAQLELVKQKYGFDKPISTQYFYYLNDLSPISFHSQIKNGLHLFKRREIFSNILIFNRKYNNCYKIPLFKGILYQTRQKGESGVGRNTCQIPLCWQ